VYLTRSTKHRSNHGKNARFLNTALSSQSPFASTQLVIKMIQALALFKIQSNATDKLKVSSPWHLLIHILLLCTWTSYSFAKWRMCFSSNSSSLWVAWMFEILLATPDLFAVCEFTLLLFAPSTPRSSLEDRLEEKPVESLDPTVHVLITYVRSSAAVLQNDD
jgi:hypothetical protein